MTHVPASTDAAHLVAVDLGNTHLRIALYPIGSAPGYPLTPRHRCQWLTASPRLPEELGAWCQTHGARGYPWYVGSVQPAGLERVEACLGDQHVTFRTLTPDDFGIPLRTENPQRVGVDRVAAAVAAHRLRVRARTSPETSGTFAEGMLVVDAGTAITMDCLSPSGEFLGGVIFPGPDLQLRSLAEFTGQLPRLTLSRDLPPPPPIGKRTEEAMLGGVYWGCLGAIREVAAGFRRERQDPLPMVTTGGWGRVVAEALQARWGYHADLVLEGVALAGIRQVPPPCGEASIGGASGAHGDGEG